MECPNCGKKMEHQEAEPEVGVFGGWFCDCGVILDDYDYPEED